jgi:hypothetical protein
MRRGLWLFVAFVAACGDVPTEEHPPNQKLTFGEMVFRIIRTNLVASQSCSLEYVGQLEPHHADFVASVDFTLSQDIQSDLPDVLGNTIVPFVKNGTLPGLVDRIGEALFTLVDNNVDPDRKTLTAIVDLANSPTLVESSMVTDLASGAFAEPNLRGVVHSTRLLMEENDGVDTVLNDVLSLASHSDALPPSTCTGLVLDDVQGTLLRTDGFVDDPHYSLGAPGWMVRPDANGNPKVLVDSVTGKLPVPFVDANNDGVADTGPTGRPIDAYGNPIDLPYLGTSGERDAQGRALNGHGGLLYDYYDVKRTALSFTMQMGGDFLDAKVHRQIPPIADAVLGQPVTCTDGTTTCRAYSRTNHPLADLTHLGLEMLRFPQTSKLMDVLHQLFVNNPDKAEDLLVATGDTIKAFQSSTISLTDTSMYDTFIGLVPLLRQIFTVSNTTGKSTPRMLVDLLASFSPTEKQQIETSLGWMVEYKSLASRPNPTPQGPLVDYRRNRFYQDSSNNWVDNRSGFEQLTELLGYADCGFIGCSQGSLSTSCAAATLLNGSFGDPDDGTVSEWLLSAMSSKSPSTVSGLISFIDWLNGFSIPFVCNGAGCALEALGCSSARADDAAAHIPALKTLANSGGLDWLLPVARVFEAQHQIPALVDIFNYLATDLWKSGQYDAKVDNANSFVRRLEQPILSSTKAGAIVKLLTAMDVLYGIKQTNNDPASYLLIDMVDFAIQLRTVNARLAPVAGSSIATELLKVMRTISSRVEAANAQASVSQLTSFASKYVTETTTLPGGRRVLAHPNVRMQIAVGLQAFADMSSLTAPQQACYIDYFQDQSEAFMTGRNFATLVRVLKQVIKSPNAGPVEDYVASLLRPNPSGAPGQTEAYRPILQLTAATSSAQIASDDISAITSWLQTVAKNNQSTAMTTLVALDDMLQSDTNGVTVQILRNLVGPGPATGGAPPISVFADTFGDVGSIDTGNACESRQLMTVPVLEHTVTSLSEFLLDDVNGITSIWKLVGTLAPH